jgi:hypothetical protein
MLMSSQKQIMGQFTLQALLKALGWLATAAIGGCSGWHVCDVGRLIGPPIDTEFWEERPD